MSVIFRRSEEKECTNQMPDFEMMISITNEKFYVIFRWICEPQATFCNKDTYFVSFNGWKVIASNRVRSLPNTVLLKCHFTALSFTPETFCADRCSFSFANNLHPDFVVVYGRRGGLVELRRTIFRCTLPFSLGCDRQIGVPEILIPR
jgi:hypothetical protein